MCLDRMVYYNNKEKLQLQSFKTVAMNVLMESMTTFELTLYGVCVKFYFKSINHMDMFNLLPENILDLQYQKYASGLHINHLTLFQH